MFYALPSVDALKLALPNAKIDWLVDEKLAPALTLFPKIDQIVGVASREFFEGSALVKLTAVMRARKALAQRYDAILLLHRSPMYLPLVMAKGLIFQIVRSQPGFPWSLVLARERVAVVPPLILHESLSIRRLTDLVLAEFGAAPSSDWSVSQFGDCDRGQSIVVHLGGGENLKTEFKLKRWPKMFEFLLDLLKIRGESVTLIGSAAEAAEAEEIANRLALPSRVNNLVGRTDLKSLVQEIAKAKLVIGPDSGPLHIADQLGIPTVGIYGPTSAVSWGLLGANSRAVFHKVPCRPCYRDDGVFPECPFDQRCMRDLAVAVVLEQVSKVLGAIK